MENVICVQCGMQFDQTAQPPPQCPICQDERQFVRHKGQQWTTLEKLKSDHRNRFEEEAPHLLGIGTEPEFAIGQRALLLQSPHGNLLWDCISLLDDKTVAEVKARGGIRAIAISHPHFYSSMVRNVSTLKSFSTQKIDNGPCVRVHASNSGMKQRCRCGTDSL